MYKLYDFVALNCLVENQNAAYSERMLSEHQIMDTTSQNK